MSGKPCAFCSYHADCQSGTRPPCARMGDDLEVEYADWEPWHGGYEDGKRVEDERRRDNGCGGGGRLGDFGGADDFQQQGVTYDE